MSKKYQKPCYMNKDEFGAWCYKLFAAFCKDIGWTTQRVKNYIESNILEEYTDTFHPTGNPLVVYFEWDHSFVRVTNFITGKTGVSKLKEGDEFDYIVGIALAYARYTKTRIPIMAKEVDINTQMNLDTILVNKHSKKEMCYIMTLPDSDKILLADRDIVRVLGVRYLQQAINRSALTTSWRKEDLKDFYDITDSIDFNEE